MEGSTASFRNRKTSVVATERTEAMGLLIWLRGKERPYHSTPLGHPEDADLYPKSVVLRVKVI